jgi:hypothetical protein
MPTPLTLAALSFGPWEDAKGVNEPGALYQWRFGFETEEPNSIHIVGEDDIPASGTERRRVLLAAGGPE